MTGIGGTGAGQRPLQAVVDEAVQMAVAGRSKQQVVDYLKSENIGDAEQAAGSIMLKVESQKAAVASEVKKARRGAYWKIAGGVGIIILGIALMASGAESGGRRSPFGAVIGGFLLIGSGVKTLGKIEELGY